MRSIIWAGLAAALSVAGCAPVGDGGISSCELRGSDPSREESNECIDNENADSLHTTSFKLFCDGITGAKYSTSLCDHSGALGGCKKPVENTDAQQTTWYFPNAAFKTADDVKAKCPSPWLFIAP